MRLDYQILLKSHLLKLLAGSAPGGRAMLADCMPNRDFLVDWSGPRDKAFKTGTLPAKSGRMVCLPKKHYRLRTATCTISESESGSATWVV